MKDILKILYSAFVKSLKYLLIAGTNFVILFILFDFWVDEFQSLFAMNEVVFWFFAMIVMSFVALFGMYIIVLIFRKLKRNKLQYKLLLSVLVTLLSTSFIYYKFVLKIKQNRVEEKEIRDRIASKCNDITDWGVGTNGFGLTIEEYKMIARYEPLPEISEFAENIDYKYACEGFLPDHVLILTYELPIEVEVDTFNYAGKQLFQVQTVEIKGDRKYVRFEENRI